MNRTAVFFLIAMALLASAVLALAPGLRPAIHPCVASPPGCGELNLTTQELLANAPLYLAGLSQVRMAAALRCRDRGREACSSSPSQ